MSDIQSLKSELSQLPLDQREEILAELEQSISADHRSMAEAAESENLDVCQERLDRLDAGQTLALPFGKAVRGAFRGP